MEKVTILEEDLSKPVTDFLIKQGYDVRCEVNSCDIAAVKGEEILIVELKKSLSIELLLQAVKRQKISDLVYVAIPKPKKLTGRGKWQDICHLIKRLELGLILVSLSGKKQSVEVAVEPTKFDRVKSIRASSKKRESLLKEIKGRSSNLNKGGICGQKIITSYRESAVYIACLLEKFGNMSSKQLKLKGSNPEKTYSILYSNHYEWFDKVEKGIYSLNKKGREEKEKFKELVEECREKIKEIQ